MTTPCLNCGTEIDNDQCQCSVADSDCITFDGSGRTNPLVAQPRLDSDEDNLITCEPDGLLMQLPSYVLSPPRCQAYHNANQSIANDVDQVVSLNSERYDTDTMHNTVSGTSRIRFNTAGIYVVTFQCSFAGNATGDRKAFIRKNGQLPLGGVEKLPPASASIEASLCITIQEYFTTTDYIQPIVKQDSGGALNLLATRYSPVFTATFRRLPPDE